ncbi:site-specific integrase [Aquamicrobium zhengzhouense]|uniref:Phage integrase family protein n=1 Tax=Aquamicrobium zhengzhouense TaxID=2781738 RepID=A0ABS0SCB6_9HYPH|nr:hypothetical protein [Aquamicrobium zhengzhouense]MBI1620117.1 hypothetical protein [Aquamicrobium zhengzhouense]
MTRLRKDRPGYQYRKRADGTLAHYWNPKRASKRSPDGLPVRPIPTGTDDEEISRLCRMWTDELLADLDTIEQGPVYDGRIESLVRLYRTHPDSPYHDLKHSTRIRDYEPSLRLIVKTVGDRAIAKLGGSDFRRWFTQWSSRGRERRGHGAIRKLRSVLSFGVEQRLPGCAQAREILSLIRFRQPATRTIMLTYEHARSICGKAIEMGYPSVALTQAIQWDTALRRIHIIGEWLPVQAGDAGGIIRGKTKWRGPTASDIDEGMIFTPPYTSERKIAVRHDLSVCPLVSEVRQKVKLPNVGPLIVSEDTGLPWRENYYATKWREVARAAGVPDEVQSMDTRAGAISEAEEATDNIDAARKLAGHTNIKTTLGYVRNGDLKNNRRVAAARASLRK